MAFRKISGNTGVERIFPIASPSIDDIIVHKRGVVRRARIFYLRGLRGKKARIKEKRFNNELDNSQFIEKCIDSISNLVGIAHQDTGMCLSGDIIPPPLAPPYLNESEMTEIKTGFSSKNSISPWGVDHDGLDIYPQGDMKPFQASCSGVVDTVELRQADAESNWQLEVLINCNDYVADPDSGGYFIPLSVDYVFEPMSKLQTDGQTQLGNIMVVEGQAVSQGDIIGYLNAVGEGAHVHFALLRFGNSAFSIYGATPVPLCPEPHFSAPGKDSIVKLLHVTWPSANMCYQN